MFLEYILNSQEDAAVDMPGRSIEMHGVPRGLVLAMMMAVGIYASPASAQGVVPLEPIEVKADAQMGAILDSYLATLAPAATKTDTPLIEVPQSASVITRKQLDDRNVQSLSQALTYTPGVRIGISGYDPRFDAFTIRGFDVTYTGIYRDGLREASGNFSIFKTEPYGLDNVTILRGPVSALYGLGSPGGLVDLTSKRPPESPLREVELTYGNNDRYQGQFDFGGPIDADGKFSYRLTGLARTSDTVLPGLQDNKLFLAPAFTWRPDLDTALTVLAEISQSRTPGNPAYYMTPEGRLTHIYSGDPAFGNLDQTQYRIGYAFEHHIDDIFTVRQNLRFAWIDSDLKYTDIDSIDDTTHTASRSTGRVTDHFGTFGVDNQLQAKFETGGVRHTLLGGLDYTYSSLGERMGFGTAPDLDLTTMNYGAQAIETPAYTSSTRQNQNQLGAYIQEQAKYGPWILTLSGRHDWLSTVSRDLVAGTQDRQSDHAFTGRAGLTYLTSFGLAPYASYSTSFAPTLGRGADGQAFVPTTGRQAEVGFKYQPPGSSSFFTAALFDLVQDHGLAPDPANPSVYQVQTGKVRSRGIELEATAKPMPGLDLTAAYSYLDMTYLEGATDTVGKMPSGIPRHQASLWADYTIQPGSRLAGLGMGLGTRYIGRIYGDDQNSFSVAGVNLLDASLHYELAGLDKRLGGTRLQVNATNLLDREYQSCQAGYCYWGEGRTVLASLRYRW